MRCIETNDSSPEVPIVKDPGLDRIMHQVFFELVRYGGFPPGRESDHGDVKALFFHEDAFFFVGNDGPTLWKKII